MNINQKTVTPRQRLDAMSKTVLTTEDIEIIFGYPEGKARSVKKLAIDRQNGSVKFNDHGVLADSVFAILGLDRSKEILTLSGSMVDEVIKRLESNKSDSRPQ
jgi:hypothetical protein